MKGSQYCHAEIFLIDKFIEFYPIEGVLISQHTGQRVTMSATSSALLHTLIKRQGEVVSKNELINTAWTRRREFVTDNTFYQSVLNMRRSIKQSGIDQNIVNTISRRGLVLPLSIKIERLEKTNEKEDATALKEEALKNNSVEFVSNARNASFIIFFIIILFIIFSCLAYNFSKEKGNNYLSHHTESYPFGRCVLHLREKKDIKDFYLDFFKVNGITCTEKQDWYLTSNPLINKTSIIQCPHPIAETNQNNCTSAIYLNNVGKGHEKK